MALRIRHGLLIAAATAVGCNACSGGAQRPAPATPSGQADPAPEPAPPAKTPAPPAAQGAAPAAPSALGPAGDRTGAGLATDERPVAGPCTGRGKRPAVLCVDDDSGAKGAGTAAAPYRRLEAALKAARSGDTVRVAAGSYKGRFKIAGKTVRLLGGFAGASRAGYGAGEPGDFGRRAPARWITTLAGSGDDAVVTLIDAGKSHVEGFRVTGGTGSPLQKKYYWLGGGFYISEGAVTVARNLIEGNDIVGSHPRLAVENLGAGIYAESARVVIRRNRIRNNKSGRGALATHDCGAALIEGNAVTDNLAVGDHGGGIYVAGPSLTIRGNFVARNVIKPKAREGGWGGGILVYDKGTRAELSGNVVTDNHAPEIGSGTFIDDGAVATLRNELIYANRCPKGGGAGLYVDGLDRKTRSRATLRNVTIAGHRCPGSGHGVYVENADVSIESSIVWNHAANDFYKDARGTLKLRYSISRQALAGEGNLVGKDPRFAAPEKGDFHLRSTAGRFVGGASGWVNDDQHSPAIDAGDPKAQVADEPAPNGGRLNLGAHGGTAEASRSR